MQFDIRKGWRRGAAIGLVAVVLVVAGGYFAGLGPTVVQGLPVGAGVGAQLACSGVFVSGRSLDDVVKNDVERLNPLTRINRYTLDRNNNAVSATALGLVTRTAIYRPGIGCTLLVASDPSALKRQAEGYSVPSTGPRPQAWPLGELVDISHLPAGIDRVALDHAVEESFMDETANKDIDTRAIIVVYNGQIVAERYAPGYDKDTRLLGWSASKSVEATLVGTLVAAGTLSLDAPPPVPEWQAPDDPRRKITLRQLLNMSSGLAFNEPYVPGSDSTAMLFESTDMGAYAASKPLAHAPGTVWSYSSGTANLLSRLAFHASGGTLVSFEDYARRHLFVPAGMASATFEPDESGNFVGSSYLYATARDWARFGLLYLNGGVINNQRILPASWADFVRAPAPADPQKGYGAQFWLNGFAKPGSAARQFPHLPNDTYAAEGHNDEFVAIFPSRKTVIVRLGWTTNGAEFNRDKHFSAILAALPRS